MFHATVHPAPRALIFLLFLVFSTFASATDVFINEIHYDNDGTDIGEGVEIAGPAGTDLSGWQIVLYNGATGASYGTINLSGVIADQDNGFGTLVFFRAGIQNGDPDGLALVDDLGNVIQFLSYDGEFTATNGPATGLPSTDIIVNEQTTSPVGESYNLAATVLFTKILAGIRRLRKRSAASQFAKFCSCSAGAEHRGFRRWRLILGRWKSATRQVRQQCR
ncbi:MAG: lamin tail domain-containing protein [Calditrichia bacterium]